jgi:pimeloyl-ACP methyl ester carboxylesterase
MAFERILAPQGPLAVHDFGGPADAPAIVWIHANGFASGSYGMFLRELATRLRVLALDLRGHGESFQPAESPETSMTLPALVSDLAAALRHAGAVAPGAPLYAGGHSLGALPVLYSLLEGDGRLSGGALVEAAVFPPESHPLREEATKLTRDRQARIPRRRDAFASHDELAQALQAVPAFAPLSSQAMVEHAEAVLRRDPDGLCRLRCRPAVEGFLYGLAANASPYNEIGRIEAPVLVVGADPSHPGSTWVTRMQPEIAARMPRARVMTVSGTGHLLPMQAPGECAKRLADWIRESR